MNRISEIFRDFVPEYLERFGPTIPAEHRKAIKAILTCRTDAHVKGDLSGFFGVLHPWGRQLQYHPHIHYLVPGGAVTKARETWIPTGEGFFLPAKALAALYRGKFKALMKEAGLLHLVCPDTWRNGFNVDIKPAGTGEQCIKYLTPYIFKMAISQHRIETVEGRTVTITYRKKGTDACVALILTSWSSYDVTFNTFCPLAL